MPSASPVQTIAVTGGKGGIGKTNVSANLGLSLVASGQRVILLDTVFGVSGVESLLDLTPALDLSHVVRGECSLQDALIDGPGGLMILPSGHSVIEMTRLSQIEHANLIGLFSDLAVDADTLIIDIATGLSDSVLFYTGAAREVMVVVCDEPTSIRDALSTIRLLNQTRQIRRFRVVANRTESAGHGLDLYSTLTRYADRHLDVLLDFCGSIPYDPQVKAAVAQQQAVVEAFPRSSASLAFQKLATRVKRWPRPTEPAGHVEFFVERLIQTAAL
ncbi:MAG: P-loop NTPase [Gammaproteobacteria bacterium]|nr:P-loop NTPase [Gammaproteobacteria bacterium]